LGKRSRFWPVEAQNHATEIRLVLVNLPNPGSEPVDLKLLIVDGMVGLRHDWFIPLALPSFVRRYRGRGNHRSLCPPHQSVYVRTPPALSVEKPRGDRHLKRSLFERLFDARFAPPPKFPKNRSAVISKPVTATKNQSSEIRSTSLHLLASIPFFLARLEGSEILHQL